MLLFSGHQVNGSRAAQLRPKQGTGKGKRWNRATPLFRVARLGCILSGGKSTDTPTLDHNAKTTTRGLDNQADRSCLASLSLQRFSSEPLVQPARGADLTDGFRHFIQSSMGIGFRRLLVSMTDGVSPLSRGDKNPSANPSLHAMPPQYFRARRRLIWRHWQACAAPDPATRARMLLA
jgi:hypothetical protein